MHIFFTSVLFVTRTHMFASSHSLYRSSWPWCATIPTMQCPTKAQCPRQWAEPAGLWKHHLCVRVCVCVCVCVCVRARQREWEDPLLSTADLLVLSRVVQPLSLSHSLSHTHTHTHTHTHKERLTAHADSHAWNIVCIKYLMRCVRLSGAALQRGESSCRIQWTILSRLTSPEPRFQNSALSGEVPTTRFYTVPCTHTHTVRPTAAPNVPYCLKHEYIEYNVTPWHLLLLLWL